VLLTPTLELGVPVGQAAHWRPVERRRRRRQLRLLEEAKLVELAGHDVAHDVS
jgi:hypothetical protein